MIKFESFELDNGLQVLVHPDETTPLVTVNILYKVGSRDEDESKTGFAHLFEHLMFGGSANIPSYDEPLQKVGGENNAYTTPDITNYYLSLPAQNIETAFWLESDRMLALSFDPKSLEVQRKVVVEEFKQRYLNQPYGDVWLKLRPLAYQLHPYKWATIGKDIKHIEKATLEDVKEFFYKYYVPNNAIMVVAGNVRVEEVKELSKKWFAPIPKGKEIKRNIPVEPKQKGKRILEIEGEVPLNALYKVFHVPGREDENYYAADLLSDILGRGNSSRLYKYLIKEAKLFNSVHGYVMGSHHPGLLIISGELNEGVSFEEAENAIDLICKKISEGELTQDELDKVKNQAEASIVFSETELLTRAQNLAYFTFLGDPDLINTEKDKIREVKITDIQKMAGQILNEDNSSVLYYKAKK